MPTVNEVLGGMLDNAIKNPKTTISGILTALVGVVPTLLAAGVIHGKAAAIAFSIVATAKLLQSAFGMKDAGQTPALVPGQREPVMVPSHEIPNDPAAVPVVKDPK